MAIVDFARGAQGALQQLIARRMAVQQQQFDNERMLKADKRAQQQLDALLEQNTYNRQRQQGLDLVNAIKLDAELKNQRGDDLRTARETFTPGQMVPNALASEFEAANVPTGMAVPGVAPRLYTSPTDKTGTPGADPGRAGVLLTPTQKQAEKAADDKRADQQAADTAAYREGMLGATRARVAQAANNSGGDKKQWVMRGGQPVYTDQIMPGDSPYRPPQSTGDTAQDRQRAARTQAAQGFLGRLNTLRSRINTNMGPQAGASGTVRRGKAAMGMDPDVAEYEKLRLAGGRALAVAIMGAQNLSDSDAQAWADMLPAATTDKATAERLMLQVEAMLNDMGGAQALNDNKKDDAKKPTAADLIKKYGGR